MADKGFDIEDLLISKQVSLNLPPFLRAKLNSQPRRFCEQKLLQKLEFMWNVQ